MFSKGGPPHIQNKIDVWLFFNWNEKYLSVSAEYFNDSYHYYDCFDLEFLKDYTIDVVDKKYFVDGEYYSFEKINEIYNKSFSESQIKALIFQCIIQERDKNRLNAIKKNKYVDPFTDSEKCIENCIKYIDIYTKYKNQNNKINIDEKSIDELDMEFNME
jgi:hypothetical protein